MNRLKKILIIFIIMVGIGLEAISESVYCPQVVKSAISKYKAQDYVGCIQDLEDYSDEDPSNVVAYYYTGIAYMQIGMKDKAIEAFHKVATINSVPLLSSYAIQATNCMNMNIVNCAYKKYSKTEIEEMVANPTEFFAKKAAEPEQENKPVESTEDISDIDRLIQGSYPENIHPDANKVIQETRLLQEQERVNAELNKKNRPTRKNTDESQSKSDASDKKLRIHKDLDRLQQLAEVKEMNLN